MNPYALLKLLHIFAVIIFLGNIMTGLYWMKKADKTNNFSIISFTMKGIIHSDKLFTIPGVIIITIGGFSAAIYGGVPLLKTGWIFWSLVLFTLSGLIFSLKLAPLQKKIYHLAKKENADNFNKTLYHIYLRQWERWGLAALLTPLGALVMMVMKIPAQSGF
ncbi:MAG: DUF2269 family protein [Chitinophagaceae bacterium]